MKSDVVTVRCKACQTPLQVPAGGKRLCACGTWVAAPPSVPVAEEPVIVVKPEESRPPVATVAPTAVPTATHAPASWPRIEGDLSAIERLNDGYRRIIKELNKAIVGQTDVLEQLLVA